MATSEWKELQDNRNRSWWNRIAVFWATLVLGVILYGFVLGFRECAKCSDSATVVNTGTWGSPNQWSCNNGARLSNENVPTGVLVRCTCQR